MHLLFCLMMLATAPNEPPAVLEIAATPPNCIQYKVGWLRPRWRCDYPLNTIVSNGDTLTSDLTINEVNAFTERVQLSDNTTFHVTLVRFEQDSQGRVVRGPRLISRFNERWFQKKLDHLFDPPATAPTPPALPSELHRAIYNHGLIGQQ